MNKNLTGLFVFLLVLFVILTYFFAKTSDKEALKPIDIPGVQEPKLDDWKKAHPELQTLVFESTGTSLPPNLEHPGKTTTDFFRFPEDAWLIGYKPEIVNGPNDLLHHVDVVDATTPAFFCRQNRTETLISSGKEMPSGFLPLGYGHPHAVQPVTVSTMFHNPHPQSYENVKMKLTFWYVPKKSVQMKPTYSLSLDALQPCSGGGNYTINKKSSSTRLTTPGYRMEHSGKVLSIGMHLHDFADKAQIVVNDRVVKTFPAIKNEEGEVTDLQVFYPKDFHLKKGDKIQIRARYENTSDKDVDAMALSGFEISPE